MIWAGERLGWTWLAAITPPPQGAARSFRPRCIWTRHRLFHASRTVGWLVNPPGCHLVTHGERSRELGSSQGVLRGIPGEGERGGHTAACA